MPVLTVTDAEQLLAAEFLDGRFAAIGGYWFQGSWGDCPAISLWSFLESRCSAGHIAATESGASEFTLQPRIAPETTNSAELTGTHDGSAVVLIVHAGDSRAAACMPRNRQTCRKTLVIDRLHWRNGHEIDPPSEPSADRVYVTSGPAAPETVYALEPRFVARLKETARVSRWLDGPVAQDGTRAGVVRAYSDFDSSLLAELDLAVGNQYRPGRVLVYATNRTDEYVRFAIANPIGTPDETVFASGLLTSSSTAIVLEPADYELRVWLSDDPDSDVEESDRECWIGFRIEREWEQWFHALISRKGDCAVGHTEWVR